MSTHLRRKVSCSRWNDLRLGGGPLFQQESQHPVSQAGSVAMAVRLGLAAQHSGSAKPDGVQRSLRLASQPRMLSSAARPLAPTRRRAVPKAQRPPSHGTRATSHATACSDRDQAAINMYAGSCPRSRRCLRHTHAAKHAQRSPYPHAGGCARSLAACLPLRIGSRQLVNSRRAQRPFSSRARRQSPSPG